MSNVPKERFAGSDLIKCLFTLVVVLHHSGVLSGVLRHGYMVVEAFFFLSGFLLYYSYHAHPERSARRYLFLRYRRFYPEYIAAFAVLLAVSAIVGKPIAYNKPWSPVLELLLMQQYGLPGSGGYNYPLWYLSCLIPVGTMLWAMLRSMKRPVFCVVAGSAAACGYAILVSNGGIEQWGYIRGLFYGPMVRAIAAMSLGALWGIIQERGYGKWVSHARALTCVEVGAFSLTITLMCLAPVNDYLLLVVLLVYVACAVLPCSLSSRLGRSRLVQRLAPCQYAVYLNHAAALTIMNCFPASLPRLPLFGGVLAALTFYAALSHHVIASLLRALKRKAAV